jgi:hypothetical protein
MRPVFYEWYTVLKINNKVWFKLHITYQLQWNETKTKSALLLLVRIRTEFLRNPCNNFGNESMKHAHLIALMMEAASTSETAVNFYPEESHHHTRRRENLTSHLLYLHLHFLKTTNNNLTLIVPFLSFLIIPMVPPVYSTRTRLSLSFVPLTGDTRNPSSLLNVRRKISLTEWA